jgi:hypothetical protein
MTDDTRASLARRNGAIPGEMSRYGDRYPVESEVRLEARRATFTRTDKWPRGAPTPGAVATRRQDLP